MSWVIPRATAYSFHEGDKGIGVWALQRAINLLPDQPDMALDGRFGPNTERAVKSVQARYRLTSDGIAGPQTQRTILGVHVASHDDELPVGLLAGFAEGEGGWLLAPVNWSVAGGVDCGAFQRRVYEADYDDNAVIQRAFDAHYQARLLSERLLELRSIFSARAGTRDGYAGMSVREKAWRLAALNHNYPSAADRLSRTPLAQLGSYWTRPASWVTGFRFRFPDGTSVQTPLQWCHLYAGLLGQKYGTRGTVTKYVKVWGI